jgi:hypothetical protein
VVGRGNAPRCCARRLWDVTRTKLPAGRPPEQPCTFSGRPRPPFCAFLVLLPRLRSARLEGWIRPLGQHNFPSLLHSFVSSRMLPHNHRLMRPSLGRHPRISPYRRLPCPSLEPQFCCSYLASSSWPNLPIPLATSRNSPLNRCALGRWALFHDVADYEQHQWLRSGGLAVADGPVREGRGRVSASVPRTRMVSDRCACTRALCYSLEVVADAKGFIQSTIASPRR